MSNVEIYLSKEIHNIFKYWSNACGDLHRQGNEMISEEQLPKELKRAYQDLWSENLGTYCYLAEYRKEYGIALIGEYNEDFAISEETNMEMLFETLKNKAKALAQLDLFQTAKILLYYKGGFEDCHEFIVFLPYDIETDTFKEIADLLYSTLWNLKLLSVSQHQKVLCDLKKSRDRKKFQGYDVALMEKEYISGLTKEEVLNLFDSLNQSEAYPIELEARQVESSAMGFITKEAAGKVDYDYEASGLHDFIAAIMENVDLENASGVYTFRGLEILLTR